MVMPVALIGGQTSADVTPFDVADMFKALVAGGAKSDIAALIAQQLVETKLLVEETKFVVADTENIRARIAAHESNVSANGVEERSQVGSGVSANSSASNGRARRRAAWKRKRKLAARAETSSGVSASSSVNTYSRPSPVVETEKSDCGFCYIMAVLPQHVALAKKKLGSLPTFRDLLLSPAQWYDLNRYGAGVTKVDDGLYHLSNGGMVPFLLCLQSIKSASGISCPAGSLGASLVSAPVSAVMLRKAPSLDAVLGATRLLSDKSFPWLGSSGFGSTVESASSAMQHICRKRYGASRLSALEWAKEGFWMSGVTIAASAAGDLTLQHAITIAVSPSHATDIDRVVSGVTKVDDFADEDASGLVCVDVDPGLGWEASHEYFSRLFSRASLGIVLVTDAGSQSYLSNILSAARELACPVTCVATFLEDSDFRFLLARVSVDGS